VNVAPLVVVAALLGLIPGFIASSKGYSFLGWWLFGALIWIVALPMAIMLRREDAPGMRPCPHCRSAIPRLASVCANCTREVTPVPASLRIVECPNCHAGDAIAKGATAWTCASCDSGWTVATRDRSKIGR
jgi:hypothetical protein